VIKMPCLAEPMIYLYPPKPMTVSVTISPVVRVTASKPNYDGNWNVLAEPSGRMTNLADGRTAQRLFWEGWSYPFDPPQKGSVVARDSVERFLSGVLPVLGLNSRESHEFLQAWLPRFVDAPYYLIAFMDRATIDRIAPLHVQPRPDAVIRVMMDYRALTQRVSAEPMALPKPVPRVGFTLVEWGGCTR